MSRILIIGGYGGFGARLSRRLAARGHAVLVGGRSLEKATRFCANMPGAVPVAADRNGDPATILAHYGPDLVIDAAGPFQSSRYAVPEACITAGIPYLDLADARDFVTGIGVLDTAARAAGIVVVSGASSVPALSGAVARDLSRGIDDVRQVDIAISASNRAGAGPSVTSAILSYVGKPMRLWRGRRWTHGFGWQDLRRGTFRAGAGPSIRRWVALADVPDHDLLPPMLPGHPAVAFRAGTELAFQNLFLWAASWPIRWGWLSSLGGAAWLTHLQRLTIRFGGDRSAMSVTVKGLVAGEGVERRWTLVADKGDGPEIPTMAAALIAEDILAGRLEAGARDASDLLGLDRFEPMFAALAIVHERVERRLAPPLYQRVMGPAFVNLPPAVRGIHSICGDDGANGRGQVARGGNPFARAIGWLMRFPPPGDHDLHVAFAERDGVETWTRNFGGHCFSSRLSEGKGLAIERFGPLRFGFALTGNEDGLTMQFRRWSCFGVPLPSVLGPRVQAREWQDGDRFRFEVGIALPLIGKIVDYAGWLRMA